MFSIIKDVISFFLYILVCSFRKNRKIVLLYHSVDNIPPDNDPNRMNINPALFERHMSYIARKKGRFLVTIDDGYGNNYTYAFPVIKKLGIATILFLTTDYIDGKMSFDNFFCRWHHLRPLTWDEVRIMAAGGIRLGCHSLTHQKMANLDEKTAHMELVASRERIKAMTGCDAVCFSYPFGNAGSFNEKTDMLLRAAGYDTAYTNIMGMDNTQDDPLRINRIRIYGTDNMFRFRMKTAGAYNWVDLLTSGPLWRKPIYDSCK